MVNLGVGEGRAVGGGTSVLVGALVQVGTGVDEGCLVCVTEGEVIKVRLGEAVAARTDGSTIWVVVEQPRRMRKTKTSNKHL